MLSKFFLKPCCQFHCPNYASVISSSAHPPRPDPRAFGFFETKPANAPWRGGWALLELTDALHAFIHDISECRLDSIRNYTNSFYFQGTLIEFCDNQSKLAIKIFAGKILVVFKNEDSIHLCS